MNKTLSAKERRAIAGQPAKDNGGAAQAISLRSELFTTMPVLLVGTRPLIVNAWSEKALGMIRDKQTKEARTTRAAKNPQADFEAAKYRAAEGWEGVPAHGLKGAFTEGARFVGGSKELNMTVLKSALRVIADCPVSNLLRLYSPGPATMREDKVRVGQGMAKTVDLRYRPEYWPWFLRVTVQFPSVMFSPQQIADLIRAAGAFNGFCEWRPGSPISRTGSYGTFEIADDKTVAAFESTFGVRLAVWA
jgi:hypothetical protein